MVKQLKYILLFSLIVQYLNSQTVYKDVAGIFYARCTSCHHTGASDFPFMNYSETAPLAANIQFQLNLGLMPPWKADTNYTRFQHERIITASEKQKLLNWVIGGALKGDTSLAPSPPIYPDHFQLAGEADITIGIGTFTSTATNSDKYYCFSIPSGLTQDRILRAFEVVPGNKAIVHHAVITADTNGTYASDLSGSCFNIPGNMGIGTYAPGSKPTVFPSKAPLKAGMFLKAGSKIIIQVHYPAGSAGQVDSTKIRLYFYPEGTNDVRRIYSETPLQNWAMTIPANTVIPFSAYYPSAFSFLPNSLSAFAVMPHSHLLCESIIYYALKPGIDTIQLVRINKWDFEWQDYYTFKKLVKIPFGYKLYSKHVYDNTVNNPNNPNNPPQTVYSNTGTKDEMLFDGMMYLMYQPGDELIDVESIINNDVLLGIDQTTFNETIFSKVFPIPFNDIVNFEFSLLYPAKVQITIHDVLGRTVIQKNLGAYPLGKQTWLWDGKSDTGDLVSEGIYFYEINSTNFKSTGKLIKQN